MMTFYVSRIGIRSDAFNPFLVDSEGIEPSSEITSLQR